MNALQNTSSRPRLTDAQFFAIVKGSPNMWLAAATNGTRGDCMNALARRGLAKVRFSRRRGVYEYKLTRAGNALRVRWTFDDLHKPVHHTPIAVRCTFCGAEFPDGTPGGSCHACGMEVERA